MKLRPKIALILGTIFFIIALFTLPDYGTNWDTINHLPRGQAYLNYFLTGKKDFSNLPKWKEYWQDPDNLFIKSDIPKSQIPQRSLYQSDGTTFSWFLIHDGDGHPPISDILSSVFNKVLFQDLRLINDIDSYRVYSVLLSALLVALIFMWTSEVTGSIFGGIIASLSLALYPLFWAESHFNNEKDVPETVFWSFMFYFVWKSVKEKKWKWMVPAGIMFGLSLGTKFNILFAPLIIVPWLVVVFLTTKFGLSNLFKLFISSIAAFAIGISIFILSWPYLWADPITRVLGVLKFYKDIGTTVNLPDPRFIGLFKINLYPIYWITFTTPIILIFLLCVAISFFWKRTKSEKDKTTLLFLLWLVVPIFRVSVPGSNIYGGVRQIMEYIPALAILTGIGTKILLDLSAKTKFKKLVIFSILLCYSFLTFKLYTIHPNENTFFNSFIGGLKGAEERNIPSWGNTFGGAYRKAISWIDKNAPPKSNIVLVNELLPNIPRIFVRSDLLYQNSNRSGYLRNGEYAITLTYQGTSTRSYYDSYLEKFEKPVFQEKVDGVAVAKVWKNSNDNLYKPTIEKVITNPLIMIDKNGITIDARNEIKVSRLEISYSENKCTSLQSGIVQIGTDGKKWESLPGVLPNYWVISYLKEQPMGGSFIEPFVGQTARFIKLNLTPADTCLKNIQKLALYELI